MVCNKSKLSLFHLLFATLGIQLATQTNIFPSVSALKQKQKPVYIAPLWLYQLQYFKFGSL